MEYTYNREAFDPVIAMLVKQYPATFFLDGKARLPQAKNIVALLTEDGFPVAHDLLTQTLEWYQGHVGYQVNLKAGAKRIDLDGKACDTVTEYEANVAGERAKEAFADIAEQRRLRQGVIRTVGQPVIRTVEVEVVPKIAPELEELWEAFSAVNKMLPAETVFQKKMIAMGLKEIGVMANNIAISLTGITITKG